MLSYPYLIIGAGVACQAAIEGIRKQDPASAIGVLSDEIYPAYNRSWLSHRIWQSEDEKQVFFKHQGVQASYHLNKKVISINPQTKTVTDQFGSIYHYQKLLLATGSIPNKLQIDYPRAIYYHTLADYYALKSRLDQSQEFVINGAGLLGCELTALLRKKKKDVTLIFSHTLLFEDQFPKGFGFYLTQIFEELGVQMRPRAHITEIAFSSPYDLVTSSEHETIQADGVIIALGSHPNESLAQSTHLNCDQGIIVNRYLQTSNPSIYAAGDGVSYYNPYLERRERHSHEETAKKMGEMAGQNMAGARHSFEYLPHYTSSIFEYDFTFVGILNNSYEMIEDWIDIYRRGVVYYLKEGRVVGGLLINQFSGLSTLKQLIESKATVDPSKLIGLISNE
jgi:3-phenylpropionate/trans-cinnamate dioxygenase ferredoxin reductase subunit